MDNKGPESLLTTTCKFFGSGYELIKNEATIVTTMFDSKETIKEK